MTLTRQDIERLERLERGTRGFPRASPENQAFAYALYEFAPELLKMARECLELRNALRVLRNEVHGTLKAHEIAIRYDSGNSNWRCLEIALEKAEALLRPASETEGDGADSL